MSIRMFRKIMLAIAAIWLALAGCTRTDAPPAPNQPATPNRTVRVPDEVWEAAKRVAADRDETLTEVIIRALVRYVREHPLE